MNKIGFDFLRQSMTVKKEIDNSIALPRYIYLT